MLNSALLLYVLPLLLCCQSAYAAVPAEKPADAYGTISADKLLQDYAGFAAEYAAYTVSTEEIDQVQSLQNVSFLVLFGSWCHDSEREVPRLLKLLQHANIPLHAVQLEAVDRQKEHPADLQLTHKLRFTPTIIVLRDGNELGRIVEKPQQSLAADLAQIMAAN